jgi:UPF0716 protein FxsA
VPTRELLDGVLVLFGGLMICVPGFISDALGLLLMIGPVRHLLIRVAGRQVGRRVQTMRPVGWTVIDVGSRPMTGTTPYSSGTAQGIIEAGERTEG